MTTTILIVDDSPVERLLVESILIRNPSYRVILAENGREAIQKIEMDRPNLVVTDLLMPEMDGLELVRHVRRQYPDLPVILMTAHGDETTAFESLEAGAASYVPKSRRAERLVETVDRVVSHSLAQRNRRRLGKCILEYNCRFWLENDLLLLRTFVDHVQEVMADQGFGDTVERIRTGEALEESLMNALYHGNLEIDEHELARVRSELDDHLLSRLVDERRQAAHIRERRILVIVHLTPTDVRFVVRDQGQGFSTKFVTSRTATDRFEQGGTRGLTLIESLMDEVSYNAHGNEMTMCKRLPRAMERSET
ncbi:MAG: response regulator [Planctomycetaceae bacterium]|nr:response regulator [Planctomycetales bacterium]MCB9927476.1 response regulator [Planctomycetaceae bacterium]